MARKPTAVSLDHASAHDESAFEEAEGPGKDGGTIRKPMAIAAPEYSDDANQDYFEQDEFTEPAPTRLPAKKSLFSWGSLFVSAMSAIFIFGIGLWITQIIEGLYARFEWMGWFATALLAVACISLLFIITKEILALLRLRKLQSLREEVTTGLQENGNANKVLRRIANLYADRDDMDWHLTEYVSHDQDILDGKDRILFFERTVMKPLDQEANRIIMNAAKRVSVVTAVNPAPALDVLFVGYQVLSMLRKLMELYGSRPGSIGTLRLARMVGSHLAITGGLAFSDTVLQQFLGKGVAGRLSVKLGEGTVNGILTSRIGLAAIEICRPMPFTALGKPNLRDFLGNIFSSADKPTDAPANIDP